MPLDTMDVDLGLDLEWKIWDGTTPVKGWPAKPIKAAAWNSDTTSCFLGDFEGKFKGQFTLELNVKKDARSLRDLHPRVEIVKNPGYWCWL